LAAVAISSSSSSCLALPEVVKSREMPPGSSASVLMTATVLASGYSGLAL